MSRINMKCSFVRELIIENSYQLKEKGGDLWSLPYLISC